MQIRLPDFFWCLLVFVQLHASWRQLQVPLTGPSVINWRGTRETFLQKRSVGKKNTRTQTHTQTQNLRIFRIFGDDTCAKLCQRCSWCDARMCLRLSVPSIVLIRGMLSFRRHVWCLFWRTHLCPCSLSLWMFSHEIFVSSELPGTT